MMCKYKNFLGEPNLKFHKHFFGFAINDLIGTIILAYLYVTIKEKRIFPRISSVVTSFIILFLIGEYLHLIFCVDSSFLKLFKFSENKC